MRRQNDTWWFHSSGILRDVHRGQRAFYHFLREVQSQDWGKYESSQVSLVDRRHKIDNRTKEERRKPDFECVHHQHTFHGSSLKVYDMFLSYLSQMKLQRFPTDCSEIELIVTTHFLFMFLFYRFVHCPRAILVCFLQPAKNGILYHRDSQDIFVI